MYMCMHTHSSPQAITKSKNKTSYQNKSEKKKNPSVFIKAIEK